MPRGRARGPPPEHPQCPWRAPGRRRRGGVRRRAVRRALGSALLGRRRCSTAPARRMRVSGCRIPRGTPGCSGGGRCHGPPGAPRLPGAGAAALRQPGRCGRGCGAWTAAAGAAAALPHDAPVSGRPRPRRGGGGAGAGEARRAGERRHAPLRPARGGCLHGLRRRAPVVHPCWHEQAPGGRGAGRRSGALGGPCVGLRGAGRAALGAGCLARRRLDRGRAAFRGFLPRRHRRGAQGAAGPSGFHAGPAPARAGLAGSPRSVPAAG
mmetsp:Transcript_92935/g.277353  ORF Transcript_92935/g.277353 Transcript_92935/m.277353 type:complete len:266 (-) Transcript_92935:185-982(-)